MTFLPRNWEGYYIYSSRVGVKLCLLIGVRTLPFIRLVIYIDLVHDKFGLAWVGDNSKMWGQTWLSPHPRPLENAPHTRALPYMFFFHLRNYQKIKARGFKGYLIY